MALIYCLGRFCIDSIRQGLVMVGPLAFDQICEIVLAVLCLVLLLVKKPRQEEPAAEPPAPVDATAPEQQEAVEAPAPEAEEPAPAPEGEKPFTGLD